MCCVQDFYNVVGCAGYLPCGVLCRVFAMRCAVYRVFTMWCDVRVICHVVCRVGYLPCGVPCRVFAMWCVVQGIFYVVCRVQRMSYVMCCVQGFCQDWLCTLQGVAGECLGRTV